MMKKRNIVLFALGVLFLSGLIGGAVLLVVRLRADVAGLPQPTPDSQLQWARLIDRSFSSTALDLTPSDDNPLDQMRPHFWVLAGAGNGTYNLNGSAKLIGSIDSGSYDTVWQKVISAYPYQKPAGTDIWIRLCADNMPISSFAAINADSTKCLNYYLTTSQYNLVNFEKAGQAVMGRYLSINIRLTTTNNKVTPQIPRQMSVGYTTTAYTSDYRFGQRLSAAKSISKLNMKCKQSGTVLGKMDILGLDAGGKEFFIATVPTNMGKRSMTQANISKNNLTGIVANYFSYDGTTWGALNSSIDELSYANDIQKCFPASVSGSNTTPRGNNYVIWDKEYDPVNQNPSSESGYLGPWALSWGKPARGLAIHGFRTDVTTSIENGRTNGCIRLKNYHLSNIFNKVIVDQTVLNVAE